MADPVGYRVVSRHELEAPLHRLTPQACGISIALCTCGKAAWGQSWSVGSRAIAALGVRA